jgi:hypothetical protein
MNDGLVVDLELTRLDHAAEGLGVAEGAFQRVRESDLRIGQAVILEAAFDGEPHRAQHAKGVGAFGNAGDEGLGAQVHAFRAASLDDLGRQVTRVAAGAQDGETFRRDLGG